MPIENKKREKANKQVIVVGVLVIVVSIAFLGWKIFFAPEEDYGMRIVHEKREVPQIDFSYLESSEFGYFEKYETITIPPLRERDLGRDNPFLPY